MKDEEKRDFYIDEEAFNTKIEIIKSAMISKEATFTEVALTLLLKSFDGLMISRKQEGTDTDTFNENLHKELKGIKNELKSIAQKLEG